MESVAQLPSHHTGWLITAQDFQETGWSTSAFRRPRGRSNKLFLDVWISPSAAELKASGRPLRPSRSVPEGRHVFLLFNQETSVMLKSTNNSIHREKCLITVVKTETSEPFKTQSETKTSDS